MRASRIVERGRDGLKVGLTRYPQVYDRLRRPYAAARFFLRRTHDPDYGVFSLLSAEHGVFLDVGANAGMSALSFRTHNRRSAIVSIEPNPFHEADLRFTSRLASPFSYRMWAAGATDDEMTLHVPVFRGVPLTTEASLVREEVIGSPSLRERLGDRMDGDAFEIATRTVPVRRLDALALDTSFVKLDVQGFEYPALQGLTETIERTRPMLLVETPGSDVGDWLAERGYSALRYDATEHRLVRDLGGAINIVFLPDERADALAPA